MIGEGIVGIDGGGGREEGASQKPLLDLKNLQFFLEGRDYSKINLVDLIMSLDPLSTFRSTF